MPYKYNPLLAGKLDRVDTGASRLNELEDVNTSGTANGYVLTYGTTLDTWTPKVAPGGGDMEKSVYDTSDDGVVDNSERLEGESLATVQAHTVDAMNILGTIADANIPDVETLSYSVPFADAQIPTLDATKILTGTFNAAQIPELPTSRIATGTFVADRIPTMENLKGTVPDGKIPDVESLSYGGAFAAAQIPNLAASKITTGTFGLARIPAIDDARIPDLETLSYGGTFATGQIPNLAASIITTGSFNAERIPALPTARISTGTFNLARIPSVDDARIPNLETLSYGAPFATAQIPAIGAYKITSGTLAVARHETLDNLNGTVALTQIPTMDDGHIPNLETLSYGGAFATAQVPPLGAYKTASGTLGAARIPSLPTSRITTGTFDLNRIPAVDDARIPDLETLSYGAAFAAAQIPNLTTSKITSGSFNADRIPVLPTSRVTSGTFADARIPDVGVVAINYVIDGGGAAITAGTVGFLEIPFACHVDRWTLLADQHGSVVIDIWRDAYSNYPPTDADSMPGTTNMPAISGTVAAQGADLSGWGTQGIASGDILAYHVDSCTSIELCTIALKVTKT